MRVYLLPTEAYILFETQSFIKTEKMRKALQMRPIGPFCLKHKNEIIAAVRNRIILEKLHLKSYKRDTTGALVESLGEIYDDVVTASIFKVLVHRTGWLQPRKGNKSRIKRLVAIERGARPTYIDRTMFAKASPYRKGKWVYFIQISLPKQCRGILGNYEAMVIDEKYRLIKFTWGYPLCDWNPNPEAAKEPAPSAN